MKIGFFAAAILGMSFSGAALAAQADAICHEKALTRQEQDLCVEQIKHAQSMPEQKAIQAKFRKRVEERNAVARVVDRAEHRRRGHALGRRVVVEVALGDDRPVAEPTTCRIDHLRCRVDAPVPKPASDKGLPQAAVTAGEIQHLVAGRERSPERDDQLRSVVEVGADVRIGLLRPVPGPTSVLVVLRRHSASSRSGCLRTKRAIPRACQSVCRERKRRSITAAYACVTTAPGTYQRSQPAWAAR